MSIPSQYDFVNPSRHAEGEILVNELLRNNFLSSGKAADSRQVILDLGPFCNGLSFFFCKFTCRETPRVSLACFSKNRDDKGRNAHMNDCHLLQTKYSSYDAAQVDNPISE